MPLSKKQLSDVCLSNGGVNKCRYLSAVAGTWGQYECLKLSGQKKVIDGEVLDTLAKLKAHGQDPTKQKAPLGDNCQGYPLLRHITQGYDV